MRVTVTGRIQHRCPYVDETDTGTVEASWDGNIVELHALAQYLGDYRTKSLTHEQVTVGIATYLADQGADHVEVTTRWQTAGLDVEVTA